MPCPCADEKSKNPMCRSPLTPLEDWSKRLSNIIYVRIYAYNVHVYIHTNIGIMNFYKIHRICVYVHTYTKLQNFIHSSCSAAFWQMHVDRMHVCFPKMFILTSSISGARSKWSCKSFIRMFTTCSEMPSITTFRLTGTNSKYQDIKALQHWTFVNFMQILPRQMSQYRSTIGPNWVVDCGRIAADWAMTVFLSCGTRQLLALEA